MVAVLKLINVHKFATCGRYVATRKTLAKEQNEEIIKFRNGYICLGHAILLFLNSLIDYRLEMQSTLLAWK